MPFSTDNAVVRLFPPVVTRSFPLTPQRLSPSISAVRSLCGIFGRIRRPLSGLPLAAVLAAWALMPATGAQASTDTVTTLADSGTGSLRATVAAASPGDIINFSATLTGGTITLASTLTISQDLTIQGPGASSLIISGGNAVGVFDIASGTVMISGLTIANGSNPGGGGIFNASTLTVSDCIFAGNSAPGSGGGGGAITNLRTLTVSNSTFAGNSAPGNDGSGGAILNLSGSPALSATLTVSNSTFFGNSATAGGAIFNLTGPSTVSSVTVATVSNSTFANNSASVFGGGAIYNQSGGPSATITVNNSIFSGNSSPVAGGGGAIYNSNNGGAVDIANASNNVFFNNTDVGGGEDDCVGCTSNASETTTDPMLLPLANYGGATQTMLPQPGSSAICAGNNAFAVDANNNPLITDQRRVSAESLHLPGRHRRRRGRADELPDGDHRRRLRYRFAARCHHPSQQLRIGGHWFPVEL